MKSIPRKISKRISKRRFTLLEILVALVLIGILFGVLLDLLGDITRQRDHLAELEKKIVVQEGFRVRLSQVFYHIPPLEEEAFYSKVKRDSTELYFFYDNQIDRDPDFSDFVKGKIGVAEHALVLTTKALKGKKERKETLLEGVRSLECSFLKETGKEKGWETTWSKECKEVPRIVKISITFQSNQKIDYAFFLGEEGIKLSLKEEML